MTTTFEVLAQPHRRQILDLLLDGEHPVGALVEATALSQPAVSKHLRVLRDAGLVEVRTEAQRRVYRLRAEPLRSMDEWLAPYRRLWAASLDALEQHLADMDDDGGERVGQRGERAGSLGSGRDAPGSAWDGQGSMRDIPGSVWDAPGSGQNALGRVGDDGKSESKEQAR